MKSTRTSIIELVVFILLAVVLCVFLGVGTGLLTAFGLMMVYGVVRVLTKFSAVKEATEAARKEPS